MSRPRWEQEGRDWPNRAHSRFVDAGGLRWHVQLMGSGPVALLLHGTGAATHSWRDLMPVLAKKFTVVAPDLPGHGFTTGRIPSGLTMPAMGHAVAGLLTALELSPQLVVGHSAGAAIGIRMALDGLIHPAAIVGLNAALQPFPGLGAKIFPTLAKLLFANPFAPHVFARIARQPGETGRFLAKSTSSRIDARGVDLYQRLFATSDHCAGAIHMMADWDLAAFAADLPKLNVPLLLLHGAADSAVPPVSAERAAAAVAHGTFVSISGGHLAHEEHPTDIAARIAAFARDTGML